MYCLLTSEDAIAEILCNAHHEYACWRDIPDRNKLNSVPQNGRAYWLRLAKAVVEGPVDANPE